MRLAGARVLLTGATGGLGRAVAHELAGAGVRLALGGREEESLRELAASLPGKGHSPAVADLRTGGAPARLLEAAGEPLDGFVSAAGVPAAGWLSDLAPEQLAEAVRVNLEAPMQIALLLVPRLLARREGHLLFVSSLAGKVPSPGASLYCATKFGLRGFALALRTELARSGVGVSVVSPGFVRDAGMFADSGARMPPVVGSLTARQVAGRVRTAMSGEGGETVAAPLPHRALAHAMACAPGPWLRALSGRDAVRTAREIAAGHARSRR